MQDTSRQFTANDMTDAYWRGYYAALSGEAPKPRRKIKVPRGFWMILAILVSLAMWGVIVGSIAAII